MIIIADQDSTEDLLKLLNNGTTQSLSSHTGVKREDINWIDDFQTDLEDLKDDFTVHETINFSGKRNQTIMYKETFKIPRKGIYSTFFLFGKHRPVDLSSNKDSGQNNSSGNHHGRALVPVV